MVKAEAVGGQSPRTVSIDVRDDIDPVAIDAAVTWLNTHVDPKLFLFVHLYEPHMPFEPPPAYKDLAPYDGEIAAADAAGLKRLRKRLEKLGE